MLESKLLENPSSAFHPAQKSKRIPSWISRLGRAPVKPNGWLGERMAVPCALHGGPKAAPTTLLTLAELVRLVMLNASAG